MYSYNNKKLFLIYPLWNIILTKFIFELYEFLDADVFCEKLINISTNDFPIYIKLLEKSHLITHIKNLYNE